MEEGNTILEEIFSSPGRSLASKTAAFLQQQPSKEQQLNTILAILQQADDHIDHWEEVALAAWGHIWKEQVWRVRWFTDQEAQSALKTTSVMRMLEAGKAKHQRKAYLQEEIRTHWPAGLPVDIESTMTIAVLEMVLKVIDRHGYPQAMVLVTCMALKRIQRGSQKYRGSRKGIGRAGASKLIGVDWIKAAQLSSQEAHMLLDSKPFVLEDLQQLDGAHQLWVWSSMKTQ